MALIGVEVGTPVERVTARGASRAEAALLGTTPAAPVLAVERTYYDRAAAAPWRRPTSCCSAAAGPPSTAPGPPPRTGPPTRRADHPGRADAASAPPSGTAGVVR
ncbi:UTRA domain-containing protein [Kitasatospora arboriphila]